MKILVAEDDGPVAEFLRQKLGQEQFAVQIASTGGEAQRLAGEQPFDMVLLDLNLNGATGLDVLRGLDAGADDYVAKPFAFAELAARIRAVLRRGARPGQALLQIDDLKPDRLFTHSTTRETFDRPESQGVCAA